jgi:hypothetical protein
MYELRYIWFGNLQDRTLGKERGYATARLPLLTTGAPTSMRRTTWRLRSSGMGRRVVWYIAANDSEGNMLLRNAGNHLPDCTASRLARLQSSNLRNLWWKPHYASKVSTEWTQAVKMLGAARLLTLGDLILKLWRPNLTHKANMGHKAGNVSKNNSFITHSML